MTHLVYIAHFDIQGTDNLNPRIVVIITTITIDELLSKRYLYIRIFNE